MGSRGTNRKVAADQLLLFGKDEWPSTPTAVTGPKSKLMFVLGPTNPVALRMHEDAATHLAVQRGQNAYPPHLLHMSLLCMGQFDKPPTRLIERTRAIAAGIQARPIPITLDSAGLFGNSRHLALYHPKGNTLVNQFVRMLGRALAQNNLPGFQANAFMPHVTLAYDCRNIEPLPLTRNYAWISGEFMLVYSYHGQARHEELGRWAFDPKAVPYPANFEQLKLAV